MVNDLSRVINAANVSGTNIATSKSISGKKREVLFSASFVNNNVGYVTSSTRNNLTEQGALVGTGISTDFAINGTGMVVVKQNPNDPENRAVFTRSCSFRLDEHGYYSNSANYKLMAWELDKDGNPPVANSLLSSLSSVNLNNIGSKAEATTTVSLAMNLNTDQRQLKGAGEVLRVNNTGQNAGLRNEDIIIPETLASSSLKQGDKVTLTSAKENQPKTFIYGGIAISKKITETAIYNANNPGASFTIVAGAPAQNQLQADTGISITYGGVRHDLRAANIANPGQGQFNSLSTLATAIQNIGLITKIQDGRLYIASKDGNQEIRFADFGGSNMVSTLGLVDIEINNPGANGERFATLSNLKDKINKNNNATGLSGEILSGVGSLDIRSLIATSGFRIAGESLGVTRFSKATLGDNTERGRATITIDSPMHGLQAGDFIRITGAGHAQAPDGHYMVTGVNSDQFTINLINNAPAAFPAAAAAAVLPTVNATWQKVAGQSFPQIGATITADAANITITTAQNHGYLANDIVYISGIGGPVQAAGGQDVTVPDGYYIVQAAAAANTFTITPAARGAHVAAPASGNFTVQKVGLGAGFPLAATNFDTNVMTTNGVVQPLAGNGGKIRLFLPHNNYNVNDYIRMAGLPNDAVAIDNITIRNNRIYKITAKDPNWIEFEIPQTDGPGGAANIGGAIAGNVNSTYAAGANNVGPNFRIDNYSRTFSYLGLSQDKFDFTQTYNPGDSNLSLSSDKLDASHVFNHAFKVVDSLGSEHQLMLRFAKLGQNQWAAEVSALKQDGTFDIVTDREDGLIKSGTLYFNPDGSLNNAEELNASIPITWKNGSLASNITLDWGLLAQNLSTSSNKGMRQTAGPSNAMAVEPNGNTAGALTSVDIDENGYLIGTFSNGKTRKLYQIPIATFANINGLEPGDGDTYTISRQSGPAYLKQAGVNGTATIVSKAVENSTVDSTTELLKIQELTQHYQAVTRTLSTEQKMFEAFLNETR
jgi:flagellar hook-basal body protein